MDFLRGTMTQAISVAIMGAAAALMAKLLGLEKTTVITGMFGAVIGWGCCWLYSGWADPPATSARFPGSSRERRAPLHEEGDKHIQMDVPAPKKSFTTNEERP